MALRFAQYAGIDAATGFGRFGLRIEPPTLLKVVVKVFFQVDPGLQNFNVDNFFATWANSVTEVWDNKLRFRLTATGEELTARFLLQKVGSLDACDFPVMLKAGYASSSGVKFPTPNVFGGNRMYLELAEKDNTPWFLASAANVVGGNVGANGRTLLLDTQRTRVVAAAPGAAQRFPVTLQRAGGWQVAATSTAALNQFCQALAATPGVVPQPPIILHVASGDNEKMKHVTAATMNYLRARGVTANIKTNFVNSGSKWHLPFHTPAATTTVEIEVASVNEMMKQWRSDYLVSAHEFGHLIGLPDEYLSYATMANAVIRNSQPAWDTLCGTHNPVIPTRSWHNSFNDSIMSIGRTVYKAHAVTIWHALQQATGQLWQVVLP